MRLSPDQVAHITARVRDQYPTLGDAPPTITAQPGTGVPARFLLLYRHTAPAANGRSLRQVVRVVVDATGQILKLSVSR